MSESEVASKIASWRSAPTVAGRSSPHTSDRRTGTSSSLRRGRRRSGFSMISRPTRPGDCGRPDSSTATGGCGRVMEVRSTSPISIRYAGSSNTSYPARAIRSNHRRFVSSTLREPGHLAPSLDRQGGVAPRRRTQLWSQTSSLGPLERRTRESGPSLTVGARGPLVALNTRSAVWLRGACGRPLWPSASAACRAFCGRGRRRASPSRSRGRCERRSAPA
ncbi:hypothetical protein LzC2_33100 [Planctomycetes bacterium LzC2]|uniref:Uncharacterized protein n=1 Tax=Alienimonas chondri TaxID=2681879 RepID=A0ABX1VGH7_9PLAN|nr:hypothetical protein [Alienimonas chondri]